MSSELQEQISNRRRKLEELTATGIEAYPRRFDHDFEPAEVHRRHADDDAETLERQALRLRVPGRVRAIRGHGKVQFVDLADGQEKLQLFIRRPQLDAASIEVLDRLDLGDYVGAEGALDAHPRRRAVARGRTGWCCSPRRCDRCPRSGTV